MSEERGICTTIFGEEAEIPLGEVPVQKTGRRKEARKVEGASAHLKSLQDFTEGTARCKRCHDHTICLTVAKDPQVRLVVNPCSECNNKDEWARLVLVCAEVTKCNINPVNPYPAWKKIPMPDKVREAIQEFCDDCKAPSVKTIVSQLEIETVEKDFALHHPFKEQDADKWSYPHLISRNAVFRVASTKERAKYQSEKTVNGKLVSYDMPYPYEPRGGWHGEIILQTGPLLDTYDERVFLSLLKIHHTNSGFSGDILVTSLREIARTMRVGGNNLNLERIKRSLQRISRTTLQISTPKGQTMTGGLLGGGYDDRQGQVAVKFNSHMLVHYKRHAYAVFSLPEGIDLSGYAQRIYIFLASHQDAEKEISLKKWREILDIEESTPNYKFNEVMRKALAELIACGLFRSDSRIENSLFRSVLNRQIIPLSAK